MRLLLLISTLALFGCVTSTPTPASNAQQRSEARIALGIGYMEQGNMLKARENLELATEHAPHYYRAQLSLAYYYELVGEFSSAEQLYKQALKQHPENGNVLNNFGSFLCKQGHFTIADQYFNQAISQPYYYQISASYENAGLCALKADDSALASHYFERALDYEPNRPRSTLTLAKLEFTSGDLHNARIRLLKFHQRYGLQKSTLKLLAELEQKAGNNILYRKYQRKLDTMI